MALLKELNQDGMTMVWSPTKQTSPKLADARFAFEMDWWKQRSMFDRDAWLEVAHNVLAHPLRTTLTGLSVALGIFILVVMQGLGYGLQHGVESQFADDAVNSIWVKGGRTQMPYRGNKAIGQFTSRIGISLD